MVELMQEVSRDEERGIYPLNPFMRSGSQLHHPQCHRKPSPIPEPLIPISTVPSPLFARCN